MNKKNKVLLTEVGIDYRKAQARLKYIKAHQRYYTTGKLDVEKEELEHYVNVIDGIIELLPLNQKIIIELTILKGLTVKDAAIESGYAYPWASQLKVEGSQFVTDVITGNVSNTFEQLSTIVLETIRDNC